MLKKEKKYDFRKRMLTLHKTDIRRYDLKPTEDEFELMNGCTVVIPENAGIVVETAAKDFREYLDISMRVPAIIRSDVAMEGCSVRVYYAKDIGVDLEDVNAYMGYRIEVGDGIDIYGYDERGIAQAFYRLEEWMTLRKAPYIKKGVYKNKAMFSPRMVHSGYRLDEYPDEHLASIAHAGMDAILVFVKDVDVTPYGFLDFNELIRRAEKYGLDTYVYSYLRGYKHPDEPDAAAFFDRLYGKIFRECPKFKGIILVGESCEFPSKDPNTSGISKESELFGDPTQNVEHKPSPGYWPSADYPEWLNMVKNAVRTYKPDADVVFWTYNWGYAPEEDRLKLIEALPTDISLLVTFEMFHRYPVGKATGITVDYTIAQEGPGDYFVSEAKLAAKRGIRLYTMANTGGLTWDIGTIPYWPVPFQWIKRYKQIIKARNNWGLCGIMESHHYGLYPSFISQLTKVSYSDYEKTPEEQLRDIIKMNFSDKESDVDCILQALEKWSEAITYHPTTSEDQAGSLRIGTAYPLNLLQAAHKQPAPEHATAKSGWYTAEYRNTDRGRSSIFAIRIHEELKRAQKALQLFKEGVTILEQVAENQKSDDNSIEQRLPYQQEELEYLLNLGRYICCCEQTLIHTKEWYIRACKLRTETDPELLNQYLDELENIAHGEIKNAKDSIPFLELDSRLGWEPSMEYIGSPDRILWKEKIMHYILNGELKFYRNALQFDLK